MEDTDGEITERAGSGEFDDLEIIEGNLPFRRRRSEVQKAEAAIATKLLDNLETKGPNDPSGWLQHPVDYAADTARVVTSRINTGQRQELPSEIFEATCIDGIIYIRARARSDRKE